VGWSPEGEVLLTEEERWQSSEATWSYAGDHFEDRHEHSGSETAVRAMAETKSAPASAPQNAFKHVCHKVGRSGTIGSPAALESVDFSVAIRTTSGQISNRTPRRPDFLA
jgi:hypothetical protein